MFTFPLFGPFIWIVLPLPFKSPRAFLAFLRTPLRLPTKTPNQRCTLYERVPFPTLGFDQKENWTQNQRLVLPQHSPPFLHTRCTFSFYPHLVVVKNTRGGPRGVHFASSFLWSFGFAKVWRSQKPNGRWGSEGKKAFGPVLNHPVLKWG